MRDKIRAFSEKRPVIFCFILILFYCFTYIFYHNNIQPASEYGWDISFLKLAICFLTIIFMKEISRGEHKFGFSMKNWQKSMLLCWPTCTFMILNIMLHCSIIFSGIDIVMYSFMMVFFENMVTGLYEEVGIRGFFVCHLMRINRYKKNGIRNAVLISSLLFGIVHINNIVRTGFGAVIQCIYASALGITFAAVYIRTRNLWICSIFHAIIDVLASISEIYAYPGERIPEVPVFEIEKFVRYNTFYLLIIICIVCIVAGLYMIRKEKHDEILALWDDAK